MTVSSYRQRGGQRGGCRKSRRPWVDGLSVARILPHPSNWRMKETPGQLPAHNKIVGIGWCPIPAALTVHLRKHGAQEGPHLHPDLERQALVQKPKRPRSILVWTVKEVTVDKPYKWTELPHDLELEGLKAAGKLKPVKASLRPAGNPHRGPRLRHQVQHLRIADGRGFRCDGVPGFDPPAARLLASGAKGFFLSKARATGSRALRLPDGPPGWSSRARRSSASAWGTRCWASRSGG